MENMLETYQGYLQQAEPDSSGAVAYGMIVDQLQNARSSLDAKNAIHTFEIMSSTSEQKAIFQAARYRLERMIRP